MVLKDKIFWNGNKDEAYINGVIKAKSSNHKLNEPLEEGKFYFQTIDGVGKGYRHREIPIERFGELLQAIYDTETHFRMEWLWDGGFDFYYGCMGEYDEHPILVKDALSGIDNRSLKDVAPLIVLEYEINHSLVDSNGDINAMGEFIKSLK